jgi:hypothetical protein
MKPFLFCLVYHLSLRKMACIHRFWLSRFCGIVSISHNSPELYDRKMNGYGIKVLAYCPSINGQFSRAAEGG